VDPIAIGKGKTGEEWFTSVILPFGFACEKLVFQEGGGKKRAEEVPLFIKGYPVSRLRKIAFEKTDNYGEENTKSN